MQGCKNKFYMPHMVTADSEGNIWVTDVGLHQIFRIRYFPTNSYYFF